MQIEKKLIVFSILAIAIGIATIVPLAFFMSPAQAQTTEDKPWFKLSLPYASCTASSQDLVYTPTYTMGLDYTVNSEAVNTQIGARLEYYQLHIYSDQGQITTITAYMGANCTEYVNPASFQFALNGWFNTTSSSAGSFVINFNGTLPSNNFGGSTFSEGSSSLSQAFLNLQNAQTVYIDVHRLGFVTFNGDSIIVILANNEVIQHIELTKDGDRDQFIYGNIPEQNP